MTLIKMKSLQDKLECVKTQEDTPKAEKKKVVQPKIKKSKKEKKYGKKKK